MISIKTNNKLNKTINWQLSKFCEKNCHYCTSYDARKTIKRSKNIVTYSDNDLRIHNNIFKSLMKLDNCIIQLFGGEPTLHPKGIYYFNELCKCNNKEIFLVTHGDISEEKIKSISPGKSKHTISISYHYYQVDFDTWIQKVLLFNKTLNVIVSAIIPKEKKVWKTFRQNILKIKNLKIKFELKLELDNKTLIGDPAGLIEFNDLLTNNIQTFSIKYKDNISTYPVSFITQGITLIPRRTICHNLQFIISSDNILSPGCSNGSYLHLTNLTTSNEIIYHIQKNLKLFCISKTCSENRHNMNIDIVGNEKDFNNINKKFKDINENNTKTFNR